MKHIVQSASLALLTASLAVAAAAQAPSQPAKPADEMGAMHQDAKPAGASSPLKITFGAQSAEFTPEKLAALPHATVTVFNTHANANQTYSGVPLIELLKPLGIATEPRGKDFRIYLEAEGSDGYFVVYSIGEITPLIHDGTVLVADTLDGKPLTTDAGPFQLVATGEKRPARWVRNLVAIRVLHAE